MQGNYQKAATSPLIESFSIIGMYGYRDLTLSSPTAASVVIAPNGAGKTTLLNVLNSILTRRYAKLINLDFHQIIVKFHGRPEIRVDKAAFDRLNSAAEEFARKPAKSQGVDPVDFAHFALDLWPVLDEDDFVNTPIASEIYRNFGYSRPKFRRFMNEAMTSITRLIPSISALDDAVAELFEDYQIVYLPTYRRLELTLKRDENLPRRRQKPRLQFAEDSIHSGEINFGLTDIREQLESLNNQITRQSNTGYRDLTARIINDMIANKLDHWNAQDGRVPAREDLEIFFGRLTDSKTFGPFSQIATPNIEQIYGENIDDTSRSSVFLSYFLDQLTDVVNKTKDIERSVNDFIATCNKYLSGSATEQEMQHEWAEVRRLSSSAESKLLKLNRSDLSVTVLSLISNRLIALNSLSSGEKQMVSLFAKMYLYPGKKIVLIDEPELSLSLDWQLSLLPDILDAPDCRQLIAITHSPFVFDNSLENFAYPLTIAFDPSKFGDDENFIDEVDF